VVSISHHLAHAYSAFAVSPFEEGMVMIVDGVGSYRPDVIESCPPGDSATAFARESES
jgi:carbamoyltransferase